MTPEEMRELRSQNLTDDQIRDINEYAKENEFAFESLPLYGIVRDPETGGVKPYGRPNAVSEQLWHTDLRRILKDLKQKP